MVDERPRADIAIDPSRDRTDTWRPLLLDLTREQPDWIVLKNAAAALAGVGDVDTFAPPGAWPAIERRFRTWAPAYGLQVVAVCRHNWRGPNFVAVREGDPFIWSLDVKRLRTFRGAVLITVDDALGFAAADDGGFRRMRPGAEGTVKLLFNGLARGGRRDDAGLRNKGVVEAMAADPAGAMAATRLVGAAAPALRRGIRAVLDGGWSRRDMAAVEAWSLGRALLRPDRPFRQIWMRRVVTPHCPMAWLPMRRLPDDTASWLQAAIEAHRGSSYLGIDGGAR